MTEPRWQQGRGRRLFPDGYEVPRLELLDSKRLGGGITFTSHRPSL